MGYHVPLIKISSVIKPTIELLDLILAQIMIAKIPSSYKPGVLFVGHIGKQNSSICDAAAHNTVSHLGLFCLLSGISWKNCIKIQNYS